MVDSVLKVFYKKRKIDSARSQAHWVPATGESDNITASSMHRTAGLSFNGWEHWAASPKRD